MNQERLFKIILAPVISEKATRQADVAREFVFKVATTATKIEIKQAVEKLFNVQVKNVCVTRVKAKTKRFGQTMGQRKAWKKAYVSLKEGFDINFANAEA